MKFEIREQCDADGVEVKLLTLTIDRAIVTPARYHHRVYQQPLLQTLG